MGTVQTLKNTKKRLPCCDGYLTERLEQAFFVRKGVSHFEAVNLIGSSCSYPQGLISGAHLLASIGTPDFVSGIRATILASGDQASRGMFLGATLGAAIGSPEMVPWTSQVHNAEEIKNLAQAIVSSCPSNSGEWLLSV